MQRNPKFKFREREVALIINKLEANESVLLAGLRRIGKTWAMKEALARYEEQNQTKVVCYIDTQELMHPSQFFSTILDAMPKTLGENFSAQLSKGKTVPNRLINWIKGHAKSGKAAGTSVEFNQSVIDYWEPLSSAVEALMPEADIVFAFDELPFFLENLQQQQYSKNVLIGILSTLRRWREAGLPMIIGGSISLNHQLEVFEIPGSVLGGLFPVNIKAFSEQEAYEYISEATKTRKIGWWDQRHSEQLLRHIHDAMPIFINLGLDYIQVINGETDMQQCLNNEVLPALKQSFLYQFGERLSKHYSPEQCRQAEQIMDTIVEQGPLLHKQCQDILNDTDADIYKLLILLQRDDFLCADAQHRYDFSLQLLRHWWCALRGLQV